MTTLYIKTHNNTGLKYFGKTKHEGEAFEKYKGSGTYWKNHIKKHGYDVTTEIFGQFEDNSEILIEEALKFSKEHNIVKSKDWANLTEENGLGGRDNTGFEFSEESKLKMSISGKGKNTGPQSEEHKRKRSESMKGKTCSEDVRLKISKAQKGIIRGPRNKVKCPYCNKEGGEGIMNRWHFNNCKYLIKSEVL